MKERLRYARRFVVLATVAFATSWVVLAHPAYADPGGTAVPDGGAQPVPSGALTPPSSTKPGNPDIPPVAQGPLAQQVTSEEAAVEQIGEQLKQVKLDLDQVKTVKASARDAWSKADDEVTALKAKAEQEAADAYKAAVALGPLDQYASDLHKLSVIAPGLRGQPGTDAAAHELVHAEEVERAAYQAYQSADENEQSLTSKNATLTAAFTSRSAGLADLRNRNASQLAQIEADQERNDIRLTGTFNPSSDVAGLEPNPDARAALLFAWKQRGKPYVWGTQGPNTFDCSGLTWAAYDSV